jgi:hypothetical protein
VLDEARGGFGAVGGGDQADDLVLGRPTESAAVGGGFGESVQGR